MTEEKNEALVKVQGFWEKFQKPVIIVIAVIVIGVGGWYGYKKLIAEPKEEQAADALFKSQQYFSADSSKLVLNGDGGSSKGVLYVINNYGGTKAGNLAKFYAGVSYMKLGDFNNAVKYLKDFSTDAKQVEAKALACLGDSYSELNKKEDAVAAYKKAAGTIESDQANAAEYLFRAAALEEVNGKTKEALDLYKELKEKYPATDKGVQADKYIYRLSIEKN
ncbi:tetratricopeptide repeat protein [Sediminibacterium roseum]|uniref:Tetratricopeptide repeat protein n=1 Tax=Sediminibacterium roseum TaxID=1978412 RepID=A0ABW9ZSX9_9BACT|nr:tetratricopeptide repeat protein [Sediminibacterium roseum]NCI50237.1 tetratricopeptide repeat protein [Sediminibacterium roseum]